jgi:predicted amidohydrolase
MKQCDTIRVGIVQLRIRTNRTEENVHRAEELVGAASARGCRLVVLPEAFATGLNLPKSRALATSIPGPLVSRLARLAAGHGVHLVAGVLEEHGGGVFSSAVFLDDRGALLDVYRRVSIYELESHFIDAGTRSGVVDSPIGRVGLVMGYDVQFPEVLRILFAQRVELIICPTILLRPFADSIRQMVLARAAENCSYVLFCSATGENTLAGLTYLGNSMIVQSPVGIRPYSREFRKQHPVLANADREETVLVADLNLRELRRLQDANPLAKDFQRSAFHAALTVGVTRENP